MNHRQVRLDQFKWMVSCNAWRAYAINEAKELDKDQSGLFTGIAKELEAHMLKLKAERQKTGT